MSHDKLSDSQKREFMNSRLNVAASRLMDTTKAIAKQV